MAYLQISRALEWNTEKMLAGSDTFPYMDTEERRVHLASGTLVSSTMAFFGQMTLLWVRHQWWALWRADGEFNAPSAAQSCVWLMSMCSSEKMLEKVVLHFKLLLGRCAVHNGCRGTSVRCAFFDTVYKVSAKRNLEWHETVSLGGIRHMNK